METKDLQREIIDTERLADRNRIILQQYNQIQALQGKLSTTEQQLAEAQAELAELKKPSAEEENHVD